MIRRTLTNIYICHCILAKNITENHIISKFPKNHYFKNHDHIATISCKKCLQNVKNRTDFFVRIIELLRFLKAINSFALWIDYRDFF